MCGAWILRYTHVVRSFADLCPHSDPYLPLKGGLSPRRLSGSDSDTSHLIQVWIA